MDNVAEEEIPAGFDIALAAIIGGEAPRYAFENIGFMISLDEEEGDISMVTIITRLNENTPWLPPEESAPIDVDHALRACGMVEEGTNAYTIDRPVEAVVQLLSSWGLLLEDLDF
jgi:hypothetical protein